MIPTDEDLLAALDARIEKAAAIVRRQRERVEAVAASGSPQKLPGILLASWTDSLALLHWQRALLLWSTTDGTLDLRKLQPSPSRKAPDRILEHICVELQKHGEGRSVSNDDFRDIVKRVVSEHFGRPGGT